MKDDLNMDKTMVYLGAIAMLFAMLFGVIIRFY